MREQAEGRIVESMSFHRPNVVICKVVDGDKQTTIIGEYLLPSTLKQLPDLEDVPNCYPVGEPIVLGDLNADIGRLRNTWDQ